MISEATPPPNSPRPPAPERLIEDPGFNKLLAATLRRRAARGEDEGPEIPTLSREESDRMLRGSRFGPAEPPPAPTEPLPTDQDIQKLESGPRLPDGYAAPSLPLDDERVLQQIPREVEYQNRKALQQALASEPAQHPEPAPNTELAAIPAEETPAAEPKAEKSIPTTEVTTPAAESGSGSALEPGALLRQADENQAAVNQAFGTTEQKLQEVQAAQRQLQEQTAARIAAAQEELARMKARAEALPIPKPETPKPPPPPPPAVPLAEQSTTPSTTSNELRPPPPAPPAVPLATAATAPVISTEQADETFQRAQKHIANIDAGLAELRARTNLEQTSPALQQDAAGNTEVATRLGELHTKAADTAQALQAALEQTKPPTPEPVAQDPHMGERAFGELTGLGFQFTPTTKFEDAMNYAVAHGWQNDELTRHYVNEGLEHFIATETEKAQNQPAPAAETPATQEPQPAEQPAYSDADLQQLANEQGISVQQLKDILNPS